MSVTSHQPTLGRQALLRCEHRATLMDSSISLVYWSVPMPSRMPALYSGRTGQMPTALLMLDSGLLTTIVSVSLMSSISAVLTWMQ